MNRANCVAALVAAGMLGACASETRSMGSDVPRAVEPDFEPIPIARLDVAMPTGIAVSKTGRVFVSFPRWGDRVPFGVAELVGGTPRAFPSVAATGEAGDPRTRIVCAQSVVCDAKDRLWIVDAGSVAFAPVEEDAAKLVCVDLAENRVVKTIRFPRDVVLPESYLNDVRFDLDRGDGFAILTDSSDGGPNALIVVDLKTGESRRRLSGRPCVRAETSFDAQVEGRPLMTRRPGDEPKPLAMGCDGIAIDSVRRFVYWTPLAGRGLFRAKLDDVEDFLVEDADVVKRTEDLGMRSFASDGLACDATGALYLTDYEHAAVKRRLADGTFETVARFDSSLWPDSLAFGPDGDLFVACNQLQRGARFHDGADLRRPPYPLFRVRVGALPAR